MPDLMPGLQGRGRGALQPYPTPGPPSALTAPSPSRNDADTVAGRRPFPVVRLSVLGQGAERGVGQPANA